jgi:DNA-binding FadR family transcriptional regulator
LIGRIKFARALVEGRSIGLPAPINATAIATAQGRSTSIEQISGATSALLTGSTVSAERHRALAPALSSHSPEASRQAVASIVASSESQLA